MLAMLSPLVHVTHQISPNTPIKRSQHVVGKLYDQNMDELVSEIRTLFEGPLLPDRLLAISTKLQDQFREKLQNSDICMLPSYQHTLPTGRERGMYLALDVGGSTLRVALVELTGETLGDGGMKIRRSKKYTIDKGIRSLKGQMFFDWMAERIEDMLLEDEYTVENGSGPLPMGLAWSFPIEQTSPRSGKLLEMGKGFHATMGVEGQDLSELIMSSCRRRNLNVALQAIVNDSSATLLSQAYRDPSTRMSLILGTGTNAAIQLPVTAFAQDKFGSRSRSWQDAARNVIVNTEVSMFGKQVLPRTRWDDDLNANHTHPDFQPLEYFVGGRYLGEIVRLIIVEAVEKVGLFEGEMPKQLQEAYAFDTAIMAMFESDDTRALAKARNAFLAAHPLRAQPSAADLEFIRMVVRLVSHRAEAVLATAVHALWSLRRTSEVLLSEQSGNVTIACNGAVLEKYPGFRLRCQQYLDELTMLSGSPPGTVVLQMAPESSIYGAAVAVCCLEDP